jgi:hypothetical protein
VKEFQGAMMRQFCLMDVEVIIQQNGETNCVEEL